MPGDIIGELILRPVIEAIFEVAGYFTGRVIVPVVSLGKAQIAPAKKGVKVYPKWHGFNRGSNGKVIVAAEMGALIGIFFWVVFIVVGVTVYRYVFT